MFEKMDKELFIARIVYSVGLALGFIALAIYGIVNTIKSGNLSYFFFFTVIGGIICFFVWMSVNLFVFMLCDIKLIRNRLYGADNSIINRITGYSLNLSKQEKESMQNREKQEKLIELYEEGVITKEELKQAQDRLWGKNQ